MKKSFGLILLIFGIMTGLSAENKQPGRFRIASWNIGHFALGKAKTSNIKQQEGRKRAIVYRAFLQSVKADLLGVAEYSDDFTGDGFMKAKPAVFADYKISRIGSANGFQWNAQFIKSGKVINTRIVNYRKRVQQTYYILTELEIDGQRVLWAATHLDWHDTKPEHKDIRPGEMRQLVNDLKKYPRVIITGDFNTRTPEEFKIFAENGYQLANNGKYPTWPAGKLQPGKNAIDDIIVKGLEIRSVKVLDRPDLSDHALIYADFVLKK